MRNPLNFKILSFSFLLFFLVSCNETVNSGFGDEGEGNKLSITAAVKSMAATRAYQESGNITEGTFYLTFPDLNESGLEETPYLTLPVNFIIGTGTALLTGGGELKWENIGYDNLKATSSTLYLDNFSYDSDNGTLVRLETDNPYKAALLDKENGSNDLLWGKLTLENRDSRNLEFQLHHCMARICVKILVDNSNNGDVIDLSNAKVEISELIHSAESYDRLSGSLVLSDNPEYQSLELVKESTDWEITGEEQPETGFLLYQTKDFVLPPQELKRDQNRPQLTITITDDHGQPQYYDAVLPDAMTVLTSTETSSVAVPMNLSFMRELYLTLTVKLSNDDLKITFMPVTVEDWYDHDKVSLSANQAGIYSSADFLAMIKAYNDDNEPGLLHYGYKNEAGKWVFNIFVDDISLYENEIAGKMSGDDFTFDFHGHDIIIIISEDGKSIVLESRNGGAGELCNLLKNVTLDNENN